MREFHERYANKQNNLLWMTLSILDAWSFRDSLMIRVLLYVKSYNIIGAF